MSSNNDVPISMTTIQVRDKSGRLWVENLITHKRVPVWISVGSGEKRHMVDREWIKKHTVYRGHARGSGRGSGQVRGIVPTRAAAKPTARRYSM